MLRELWHAERRSLLLLLAGAGSVAVAVGGNGAAFALISALWFRSLPIADPERLVVVYGHGSDSDQVQLMPYREALRLSELPAFGAVTAEVTDWTSAVAAQLRPTIQLVADRSPQRVAAIGSGYFETLGVPIRGRTFREDEVRGHAPPVAIISERYSERLTGDTDTLMTIAGPVVVVGVVPAAFEGLTLGAGVEVWLPIGAVPQFSGAAGLPPEMVPVTSFARLRPGVSVQDAEVAAAALGLRVRMLHWDHVRVGIRNTRDLDRQNQLMAVLSVGSVIVILMACGNLAAVVLARSEERSRIDAIRLALGAAPGRIRRDVFTHVGLVTLVGLAVGFALSRAMLAFARTVALPTGAVVDDLDLGLDWRVLSVSLLAAILTGAAGAFAATYRLGRLNPAALLSDGRGMFRPTGLRMRGAVVGIHAAVSMALVVLALHLVGIVVAADVLARGYATEQTLFVRLEPKWSSYASAIGDSDARVTADAQRLVMRLRADPAVAGVAHGPPVIADEHMPVDIVTGLQRGRGVHIVADANYPDVVGLTRRAGRGFEVSGMAPTFTGAGRFSGELAPAVPALMDERLASQLWGTETALGQLFTIGRVRYETVGVLATANVVARRDRDRPLVVTLDQSIGRLSGGGFLTLALRTRGPAADFKAAIEQEVRSVFPDPAVLRVQTSDDLISKVLTAERFGARFFGVYGAAAVLLGGGGLYALSRSLIARERRALGIRMALGARHRQLVFWIITTAVRPVAAGLLAGIGLSWVVSRALLSIIPGYGSIGLVTYLIAGLVLAVAVALALARSVRAISGLPPNEVLVAS